MLGKWLGLAVLLGLYLALMAGGVLAIVYVIAGYVVPNVLAGLALLYLEVLPGHDGHVGLQQHLLNPGDGRDRLRSCMASPSSAVGSSSLAPSLQNQAAINVGIISSLIMPSEAIWRRASFEMTPPLAQVLGEAVSGPFVTASVPSHLDGGLRSALSGRRSGLCRT